MLETMLLVNGRLGKATAGRTMGYVQQNVQHEYPGPRLLRIGPSRVGEDAWLHLKERDT